VGNPQTVAGHRARRFQGLMIIKRESAGFVFFVFATGSIGKEEVVHADGEGLVVYCDGCCEGGVMGIGVYSEALGIDISKRMEQQGTSNVAECLAAIEALQEVNRQEVSGVTLCTDSELVARWVSGRYRALSATARTYVPEIRRLLEQVGGTIRWIPGSENRADANSRAHVSPKPSPDSILDYVRRTPMEDLRFRHFRRLRCGRDQYSKIRLARLKELVPQHEEVQAALGEERHVASCLRWMLRGLPMEKAIRKVLTDIEISRNAAEAAQRERGGFQVCCVTR